MKLTILGGGRVGATLGKRFADCKHEITFVVRDKTSEKSRALAANCGEGTVMFSSTEAQRAVADADAVIITLPWNEVERMLKEIAPAKGKIIIDATMPLELTQAGLANGLLVGHTTSAGEQVAECLPQSKVCKAFNSIGSEVMQNPILNGERSTLLVCGDPDAKKIATQLADEIGFLSLDVGDIKLARLIEPFGMLWIHLRFALGWPPEFALMAKKPGN